MVLQQDLKERHAAAFMITKIRSFKHEPFFSVGAEGGELIRGTCTLRDDKGVTDGYLLNILAIFFKSLYTEQFVFVAAVSNNSHRF